MWRYLILAGAIVVSAIEAPSLFEKAMEARDNSRQQSTTTNQNQQLASLPVESARSQSGRKVRIKASYGGHFYTQVRMNNRPVKVMVDTGATMVAINETTARKIGIYLKASDFKHRVSTANGTTKMASAMIKEVQIGPIRVRNVRVGIARDKALSGALLGMSFLRQLKRFEITGQTLLLEQ